MVPYDRSTAATGATPSGLNSLPASSSGTTGFSASIVFEALPFFPPATPDTLPPSGVVEVADGW